MMRMMRLGLLIMLLANFVQAQTSVVAKLDTNKAIVGKSFNLDVKVAQAESDEVFWPMITDSIGGVDIVNILPNDTQKTSSGPLLITRKYELMAFDSGEFTIPTIAFNVRSPKGNKEIYTDPLTIQVFYMPVDTTQAIKDIAPLAEVPPDWKFYLMIAGIVIAGGILIYYLYKRFRKKEVTPVLEEKPAGLLHEIALQELEELRVKGLWQQGRIKEYYTELTEILRHYITHRWNLNAMELTSDEILAAGFMKLLGQQERERLNYILSTADLVKFAKALPLPADHESCMAGAIEFVKASIPAPEPIANEEVKA